MKRVNEIVNNHQYRKHLQQIEEAEANRCFCLHNMGHFLDVARIAMVMNLEEQLNIDKELIYATGLLHDIGRHIQYADGTPHDIASADIAPSILRDCNFQKEEIMLIIDAISSHRNPHIMEEKTLRGIIYKADKLSRACFACDMELQCNWDNKKKNLKVVY